MQVNCNKLAEGGLALAQTAHAQSGDYAVIGK